MFHPAGGAVVERLSVTALPRPIWLLDEPLIALDAAAQAIVVALMAAHTLAGGAVLVASHQPLAATRTIALDIPV